MHARGLTCPLPLCRLAEQQHPLPLPSAPAPSPAELAAYAQQQWEALLLFLVSGEGAPPEAPAALQLQDAPVDVPALLVGAGLAVKDEYTLRQGEVAGVRLGGGMPPL